ncbi:MAG: Type 1 glutamine amidotransferase-like domain-containing protein [Candidatus Dormibacteria bacterium]
MNPPATGNGPLALVGSGEFTEAMIEVDRWLLLGRPARAVIIPTAAAPEGEESLARWIGMGVAHYRGLGIEPVPLVIHNRAEADLAANAAAIEGAGLVYLSGGDPLYLAETLAGSLCGRALEAAWRAGAAVAGCSAGAIALTASVPRIREPGAPPAPGLGLVKNLLVLPHFDRIEGWMPGISAMAVDNAPPGWRVVGIDEDTAMVGGPGDWLVMGRQKAWVLEAGGARAGYSAREKVPV